MNTIKHYQVNQITEEHLNKGFGDDKVIIVKCSANNNALAYDKILERKFLKQNTKHL